MLLHLMLAVAWLISGELWAKNSPQPQFVRASYGLLAISEIFAWANWVNMDGFLTLIAVLVLPCWMMGLRFGAIKW